MSDPTFAEQVRAYDRWKQERGNNWHTPESYEEWIELTRKAYLWDTLSTIWLDEDESSDSVLDFLGDTIPA